MIRKIAAARGLVLAAGCVVFILSGNALAQEKQTPAPSAAAGAAARQDVSAKEELKNKVRASLKNPAEFTARLAELLNAYPYDERAAAYLYSFNNVFKNESSADAARNLILQFVKNTEQVPAPLRANIYRYSAGVLFNNKFYAAAADLSQKIIDQANKAAYVEFKKRQFAENQIEAAKRDRGKELEEAIKRSPQREKEIREAYKTPAKPARFDAERARIDFVGLKTNAYNTLGKSFWETGKFAEAEKAYRASFAVKATKESALGIARTSEKNGRDAEALKYATVAALTGKLDPAETDYFRQLYAKRHAGKTDDAEEYLDAEYRKTYRNPVKSERYKPNANRGDRTVLAEFITGAGCIPCIPFDYSFEAALKDYSTKDLTLLVYHWHAPVWDPLGNYSADARVAYYDVKGAPTVFVDGKKFDAGDADAYNGGDGETDKFQQTFDALGKQINRELETAAAAELELKAEKRGQIVNVRVNADKFANVSDDLTLQVALVENEVSYSGENGLRFQMMVVRALAGDNEKRSFGLKIDSTKANQFDYVFDVEKIAAQNLNYYDTFAVEKTQEFKERFGGSVPENLKVEFKYKKNQINPNNLSVVAFVQDNKTKKILQSATVNPAK